ncbi:MULTISPECIES: hybrid sensor histidine kinase/response regulator [unclassified Janthinobacterium]|uniref:hybrid sensor histidine kinase/response regulator n=1 Tax=unclassified Janthinobacterium TaxID=2610881 RepID=UPI0008F46DD4|nr:MULTISPECIES: hybrid sensor histidine kinase/response regulator [unclassified Janthinobacterium]APA67373.1 histidine kinase [Janthinobacterium sp. 1_2014MBL_MicDiv]MDN2708869.1 hybrid sensor histidine kinase/response regulator [Janthinobacterium sp. SUN118]
MTAPIHILVVDDIAQNLVAAEAVLARPGIVVLKATSGAQALELLLTHEVALALIDVQMPQMDGFELAELIRGSERTRSIPLIFLTAASREPSYSFRGYEAGAVDFLYKPIDVKALQSKVAVLVQLYQQKRELSAQLDELKHALHLNELFTAVLGHDLRTPLSVVMNGAMLLPMMSDHPKVIVTAQRIESSAKRMARMVDQLLDLARIRSGTMELRSSMHDYLALARAIVDEFDTAGQASPVEISSVGELHGQCDAGLLSQVISNLLSNAITHGEAGTPVQLALDGRSADSIELRVINRGVIAAALLPTLFEPFQQAGEKRKTGQGLGLGLYTVNMFVKAHGGTVELSSSATQGTVATVRIPRHCHVCVQPEVVAS